MRNKVEIRAFAIEQVVKTHRELTIAEMVDQAKLIEAYVVGNAQLSEDGDEAKELLGIVADMKDMLKQQAEKEYHFPTYEEVMGMKGEVPCGVCPQ